jgi:hypothetical protein
MFRKHKKYHKRSAFLPFVIFRSLLSLVIFAVLLSGIYMAFKQFSGIDIIKVNLLQKDILGLVTSFLPSSITLPAKLTDLKNVSSENEVTEQEQASPQDSAPRKIPKLLFKFTLVADSHNDNENLKKALTNKTEFTIGLGDYTSVGQVNELQAAKKVFDSSGTRYFVTAGDHDLWDSRNKGSDARLNFNQVFGSSYQSFSYKNTRFLLLDNSDNYKGLGEAQWKWLREELDRIKVENPPLILVFMHEPLYHPSSTRVMGKVTASLRDEAKEITKLLKDSGVKGVFFGDIHYYTSYNEPDTGLAMTTMGALTSERNVQNPRYGVVSIFDDGTYSVEDIEVK